MTNGRALTITKVGYDEKCLIDELEVRPFDGELLRRQIDAADR